MIRFIGKTLKQVKTTQGGEPQAFQWENETFLVEKIMKQWQDFDYSPLSHKKNWRTRRHRNVYQVSTPSGRCFELYCDRGTKLGSRKQWVLSREIS
jgi:hypothetical protein